MSSRSIIIVAAAAHMLVAQRDSLRDSDQPILLIDEISEPPAYAREMVEMLIQREKDAIPVLSMSYDNRKLSKGDKKRAKRNGTRWT